MVSCEGQSHVRDTNYHMTGTLAATNTTNGDPNPPPLVRVFQFACSPHLSSNYHQILYTLFSSVYYSITVLFSEVVGMRKIL